MTYPDSGAPLDPRDELDAIRRRLAELTPAGPQRGSGLAVAGLGLTAALVALVVALSVASTLDGGAQAAVLVVGVCVVVGFAVVGFSALRRWTARSRALSRQRRELLARHDQLAAALGTPRAPVREPARWPNRNDRFRMVVGTVLGVLVLAAVVATVVLRTV
jgi:Na+/melibiose symporter-like transporter